jgi:hypothetical protein
MEDEKKRLSKEGVPVWDEWFKKHPEQNPEECFVMQLWRMGISPESLEKYIEKFYQKHKEELQKKRFNKDHDLKFAIADLLANEYKNYPYKTWEVEFYQDVFRLCYRYRRKRLNINNPVYSDPQKLYSVKYYKDRKRNRKDLPVGNDEIPEDAFGSKIKTPLEWIELMETEDIPPETKEEKKLYAQELYKAKISVAEIVKELKVPRATVYRWIKPNKK